MPIIVSALIRRDALICLVEQQGPWDRMPGWMLPGGRVEPDEGILAALVREVAEETGLALLGQPQLAFLVDLDVAEGTYTALTFSCEGAGELAPADPDGFVKGADWVATADALERLARVEWYDVIPLARYLSGDALPGATYSLDRRK